MYSKLKVISVFFILFKIQVAVGDEFIIETAPCNINTKINYELVRTNCVQDYCEIILRLKQNDKILDVHTSKNSTIKLPAGKSSKDANGVWAIEMLHENKYENRNVRLKVTTGKTKSDFKGLFLAAETRLPLEGIPMSEYEYFVCNDNKILSVWHGDTIQGGAIAVKDVDQDGDDELVVESGSFNSDKMYDIKKAVFKLNSTNKKMGLSDLEKPVYIPDSHEEIRKSLLAVGTPLPVAKPTGNVTDITTNVKSVNISESKASPTPPTLPTPPTPPTLPRLPATKTPPTPAALPLLPATNTKILPQKLPQK